LYNGCPRRASSFGSPKREIRSLKGHDDGLPVVAVGVQHESGCAFRLNQHRSWNTWIHLPARMQFNDFIHVFRVRDLTSAAKWIDEASCHADGPGRVPLPPHVTSEWTAAPVLRAQRRVVGCEQPLDSVIRRRTR
jgi:hypothetical protein